MAPSVKRAPAAPPSNRSARPPIVPVIPLSPQQRQQRQKQLKQQQQQQQPPLAGIEKTDIEENANPEMKNVKEASRNTLPVCRGRAESTPAAAVSNSPPPLSSDSSTPQVTPSYSDSSASDSQLREGRPSPTEAPTEVSVSGTLPLQDDMPSAPPSAGLVVNGRTRRNGHNDRHGAPGFPFSPPGIGNNDKSASGGNPRHFPSQPPFHAPHRSHHPPHSMHHPHPSAGSISIPGFPYSANTSPGPSHHRSAHLPPPLPPPPPPPGPPGPVIVHPYMSYNPEMVLGGGPDWPGYGGNMPPHVDGEMSGSFPPPTPAATFHPSTPGSFHGSQSPDNVGNDGLNAMGGNGGNVGPVGNGHHAGHPQGGPFSAPGANGVLAAPAEALSPFYPPGPLPNGFMGGFSGPGEHHGPVNDGMAAGMINLPFVRAAKQHLTANWNNARTADCHLHIRVLSRRSGGSGVANASERPTIFVGHRSVLSQSYTLSELLCGHMVAGQHHGPYEQVVPVYNIVLEDPYLSEYAVWQALHSLYGFRLDDETSASNGGGGGGKPGEAATPEAAGEAMDKALANLTAGVLFMLPQVEVTGAEQASALVSGWDMAERALAYCLNGSDFPNSEDASAPVPRELAGHGVDALGIAYPLGDYRYAGPGHTLLLRRTLEYVIAHFPADFVLQPPSTWPEWLALCRFPAVPQTLPHWGDLSRKNKKQPALLARSMESGMIRFGYVSDEECDDENEATGQKLRQQRQRQQRQQRGQRASVSLPMRSPTTASSRASAAGKARTSAIMFGDFSPASSNEGSVQENASNAEINDAGMAALSRILLQLPFGHLKYVLEHPNLGTAAVTAAAAAAGAIASTTHASQAAPSQSMLPGHRQAVMCDVVVHRERFRQHVLAELQAGRLVAENDGRDAILERLHSSEPMPHGYHSIHDHRPFALEAWDVLGWTERCEGRAGELARSWTATR